MLISTDRFDNVRHIPSREDVDRALLDFSPAEVNAILLSVGMMVSVDERFRHPLFGWGHFKRARLRCALTRPQRLIVWRFLTGNK